MVDGCRRRMEGGNKEGERSEGVKSSSSSSSRKRAMYSA
jgi:hypothetical protein